MVLFDAVCHQGRLWGFKKLVPSRSPGLAGPSCQLQTPFHLYFLHLFLLSSDIFCLFVCLFSKSFSSNTYSEPWLSNSGLSESFFLTCFQNHFFSSILFNFFTQYILIIFFPFPNSSPSPFPHNFIFSLTLRNKMRENEKQNLVRHKYQNKNITKSPTK